MVAGFGMDGVEMDQTTQRLVDANGERVRCRESLQQRMSISRDIAFCMPSEEVELTSGRHCEQSETIQNLSEEAIWIASSLRSSQ
jgi:hypothetical protein